MAAENSGGGFWTDVGKGALAGGIVMLCAKGVDLLVGYATAPAPRQRSHSRKKKSKASPKRAAAGAKA